MGPRDGQWAPTYDLNIPHKSFRNSQPLPQLSTIDMMPPPRLTRTTNNPGLIDLPKPKKPHSEVTTQKLKKKETAAAKAKVKEARVARVASVEQQVRIAQREVAGQVGRRPQVKKAILRERPADEDDEADMVMRDNEAIKGVSRFKTLTKLTPSAHQPSGKTHRVHTGHHPASQHRIEAKGRQGTAPR